MISGKRLSLFFLLLVIWIIGSILMIYLTQFTLQVTEKGNIIEIELSYGFSDFLKPGYAKLITCFIAKYYKKKYPLPYEIVFILDDRSQGKWKEHGFKYLEKKMSKKSNPMKYDFEEGEQICNDFFKKIGFTEFKYYDLTK